MRNTGSISNGFIYSWQLTKSPGNLVDVQCAVGEAVWIIEFLQVLVGHECSILGQARDQFVSRVFSLVLGRKYGDLGGGQ
jgi:hypothetical protein